MKAKKARLARFVKYSSLVVFVRVLIFTCRVFPRKLLHGLFVLLSRIAFRLLKAERLKTVANISKVYSEMNPDQVLKSAKEVFKNLARNAADIFKYLSIDSLDDFDQNVEVVGGDNLDKAFRRGKGVIALNCHLGAFELAGSYCGFQYPTVGIGAKLKNEALDRLLSESRRNRGIEYQHRDNAAMKLVKSLSEGKVVMMLMDQDSKKLKSCFVNFMGHKAATPIGPALLAEKTGCAVVPMAMSLVESKQVLTIENELELQSSDDPKADLIFNTQLMTTASEKFIHRNPWQWVWMHDRWKRQLDEANAETDVF